jgi:hypothetical protein
MNPSINLTYSVVHSQWLLLMYGECTGTFGQSPSESAVVARYSFVYEYCCVLDMYLHTTGSSISKDVASSSDIPPCMQEEAFFTYDNSFEFRVLAPVRESASRNRHCVDYWWHSFRLRTVSSQGKRRSPKHYIVAKLDYRTLEFCAH